MTNAYVSVRLAVHNGMKYLPLLKNLIQRELKKKYRSSVLGYVWCVLNPLLVMLIMTFVFFRMFSGSIENYPVYLFCGRLMYSFVTGGAGSVMRSIRGNAGLMRKTRIPYYVFPLAAFSSAFVDFLFSLAAFAIVLLFTGTPVSVHALAFPAVMLEAALFTLGFGLLLAVADVFLQDTEYLYAVFTVAWMYLTPLFYPLSSLSETMQRIISSANPLYFYISQTRDIFVSHAWPFVSGLLTGYALGAVFLVLGLLAYNRVKQNLILYL